MNGATAPPLAPGLRLMHDVRVTRDLTALGEEFTRPGGVPIRAVICVIPSSRSGSGTLIGKGVDAATGAIIDIERPSADHGKLAVIEEGKWRLILKWSGEMPSSGDYSWTIIVPTHKNKQELDDWYSPFARGGYIACGYSPANRGRDRFAPVFLLPQSWGESARVDRASIAAALGSDDSFALASSAYRDLVAGREPQTTEPTNTDQAQAIALGLFTFFLLHAPEPGRVEKIRTALTHLLASGDRYGGELHRLAGIEP